MPSVKNKSNIIIVLVIIIILGGFSYFYYFSKKSGEQKRNAETPMSSAPVTNTQASSLKKIQNLGEFSQIQGEELISILNLLQTIKLDTGFFQSEKFREPSDFYRILEIKDEEKGNPNLFKAQ